MYNPTLFATAILAGAGFALGSTCKGDQYVTSNNASNLGCDTVTGNVIVLDDAADIVNLGSLEQINGDLTVTNASQLTTLEGDSLKTIKGTFTLNNCNLLYTVSLQKLTSVNELSVVKMESLTKFTFGTEGVTKASTVTIADTRISDLSGLSLSTVDTFNINNNGQLDSFDSEIVNITKSLIINSNGQNFAINMSKLEMAEDIQVQQIRNFSVPALTTVTAGLSIKNTSQLTMFEAPMLEKAGSVTLDNNKMLNSISFPKFESCSGALEIENNTKVETIDGFPKLQSIGGALTLYGSFTNVSFPALENVHGQTTITSTEEISDSCSDIEDKNFDGKVDCRGKNPDANAGGDGGSDSDDSSSDDSDDDEGVAGITNVNFALLGLAGVAAIAQLM